MLRALRELQAVTDAAAGDQWCWAAQAAEALTAMQALVAGAIRHGRDAVDPAALAAQVRLFRSAALIGASQTAARSTALMKKHHALARRLTDRQDDYLRFTRDFRVSPDNEGASYCTSWVRSGVSRFVCWSARWVVSMAGGTDSFRRWAAEAGVVAAA